MLREDSPHLLISTSITLHIYLLFGENKFYFLRKFQLYNTVLSTIISMFYIRSSDLIHLIAESLYLFTNLSLFPPPPDPGNHLSPVSMSLTFSNIPYISGTTHFLCLAHFTQRNALKVHPYCHKWRDFLFSHGRRIFH